LNVLDLFSGIGGFSLGLERAGMRTVAFCEIEPRCREWLANRWPGVPIFPDVRELHASDIGPVDVICGGFPCQDISTARHAAAPGLAGARSGLWVEMLRLVRECRPAWVLVENVARLRTLGADTVLGDLEEAGYQARPAVVRASDLGADHGRARAWIVANARGIDLRQQPGRCGESGRTGAAEPAGHDAVADRDCELACAVDAEVAGGSSVHEAGGTVWERQAGPIQGHALADGLPDDLDYWIAAFGNAVVPQIPELLGRWIMNQYPTSTTIRDK
jgi:DNA (cytosine-5)-methyltransferase 1